MDANVTMVPISANLTVSPVFGPQERPLTGATMTLECEDPPTTQTATEADGGSYVFENTVPTHKSGICTVTIEKEGCVQECKF